MNQLPVDCICHILTFTSPKDACRLAGVSPAFRSAADSNLLWMTFLPADYRDIIAQSTSSSLSSFLNTLSEKDLYFHLCDHPLLIGNRNMNQSFALEEETGRKCYMIGVQGERRRMWPDQNLESRFGGVAALIRPGTLFRVNGRIEARSLTPKTYYEAYFVFMFMREGQYFKSIRSYFYSERGEVDEGTMEEKMTPLRLYIPPKVREDGWMEEKIGEIFIGEDDNSTIIFSLVYDLRLGGDLIPEGIEIRPKRQKCYNNHPTIWFDLAIIIAFFISCILCLFLFFLSK